jgi:hypothetical protein
MVKRVEQQRGGRLSIERAKLDAGWREQALRLCRAPLEVGSRTLALAAFRAEHEQDLAPTQTLAVGSELAEKVRIIVGASRKRRMRQRG